MAARSTKKASKKKASKKKASKKKASKKKASKKKAKPKSTATRSSGAPRLDVGDDAPHFDLSSAEGESLSAADLRGEAYVLYFYPRDDTPGCTVEACGFRDAIDDFAAAGVRVIGVSPDTVASHERFRDKYSLNFTLLADPEKSLANAYGTWVLKNNYGREFMGIERSTFLVDGGGVIRAVWRRVRVPGHVERVLVAAQELAA